MPGKYFYFYFLNSSFSSNVNILFYFSFNSSNVDVFKSVLQLTITIKHVFFHHNLINVVYISQDVFFISILL